MHPSNYPTAWEHPPTRRAWAKQTTISVLAFVGWFLSPWCLLVVLVVFLSKAFIPLFVLPMGYGMYRAKIQPAQIISNYRIRRIIRAYPWRLDDIPYSFPQNPGETPTNLCLTIPHPEQPGEPFLMYQHLRLVPTWWTRRMGPRAKPELKAQLNPIWFVGDPRFFGVIAVTKPGTAPKIPAPKRMHLIVQVGETKQTAPIDVNSWQASPEDLAHARQAIGWRGPRD
ncbi:hypothetical protein [Streptomyces phytophilus]|uniref:hypothetical protein n=1 Tax=Streptomyces phytophilus TaxID=722715 RepID=UPI001C68BAC1|nr:hypothetical protein [Streptomyces phytophilus]